MVFLLLLCGYVIFSPSPLSFFLLFSSMLPYFFSTSVQKASHFLSVLLLQTSICYVAVISGTAVKPDTTTTIKYRIFFIAALWFFNLVFVATLSPLFFFLLFSSVFPHFFSTSVEKTNSQHEKRVEWLYF